MGRRSYYGNNYRNPRYTGTNPVYAGRGSSYDPIEMEKNRGARTLAGLYELGDTAERILKEDAGRRQAAIDSLPKNPGFYSVAIDNRVGDILSNKKKQITDIMSKKNGLFFSFKDLANIERDNQEIKNKVSEWSTKDKQFNEQYKKYLGDLSKQGEHYDNDITAYRIKKFEEGVKNGDEDAIGTDINNLFVYKGIDVNDYTKKIIDNTASNMQILKNKYDLEHGGTGSKEYKWNDTYVDKYGNPKKKEIMGFLEKSYTPQIRASIGAELLRKGQARYADKNGNRHNYTYQDYKDNKVNPMDVDENQILEYWYQKVKPMFTNIETTTTIDTTDKAQSTGYDKTKYTIRENDKEILPVQIPTKKNNRTGEVIESVSDNIVIKKPEYFVTKGGKGVKVPNFNMREAIFLGNYDKSETGTSVSDVTIDGVGYFNKEDVYKKINKMIRLESDRLNKSIPKDAKSYLKIIKKNIDSGKLYAFGSSDGFTFIVPFDNVKDKLNDVLENPYSYGSVGSMNSGNVGINTSKFVGMPEGGFW